MWSDQISILLIQDFKWEFDAILSELPPGRSVRAFLEEIEAFRAHLALSRARGAGAGGGWSALMTPSSQATTRLESGLWSSSAARANARCRQNCRSSSVVFLVKTVHGSPFRVETSGFLGSSRK